MLSLARIAVCLTGVLFLNVQSCKGNPHRPVPGEDHPDTSNDVKADMYDSSNLQGASWDYSIRTPLKVLTNPPPRELRGPDNTTPASAFVGKSKRIRGRRLMPAGRSSVPDGVVARFNRTAVLERHNMYRARHGSPALQLNATIDAWAQGWADHLASTQQFTHRPHNPYGENIYMVWGRKRPAPGPYAAVDAWYNETKNYSYEHPKFSTSTGHFTQVVWKSTLQLGVGVAVASNGAFYVVCNYSPPGNYQGLFAQNVLRLIIRRPGQKKS